MAISPLVIIIVVFFFIAIGGYVYQTFRINMALNKGINDYSKESMESNRLMAKSWRSYNQTLHNYGSLGLKTEKNAYTFFNEYTLWGKELFRIWHSVPNFLLGLGILGTFIGLMFGLQGFDSTVNDPKLMMKGIGKLLEGTKTAFDTSVAGMFTSIFFNLLQKYIFQRTETKTKLFCSILDDEYLLTQDEKLQQFYAFQKVDDKGQAYNVYPSSFMRTMLKEAESQTAGINKFNNDLADGIILSADSLQQLADHFADALSETFKTQLTPFFEQFGQALQLIREEKQESMNTVMQQVASDFHEALAGNTKEHIEGLASIVKEAGDSFHGLPDLIKEQTEMSKEVISQLTEELKKEIGQQQEVIKTISIDIDNNMHKILSSMEDMADKQEKSAEVTGRVLEASQHMLAKQESSVNKMTEALDDIGNTFEKLTELSNSLTSVSQLMKESTEIYQTQAEKMMVNHSNVLTRLEKALIEAKNLSDSYGEKFNVIQHGLKDIFQQVEDGLVKYQHTSREVLNKYLADFSENFSQAASSLAGSISGMRNVVEEIEEAGRRIPEGIKDLQKMTVQISTTSKESMGSLNQILTRLEQNRNN